jgi:hypothetical protein
MRPVLAVLTLYALLLQGVFGAASMAAALTVLDGHGVICHAGQGDSDARRDMPVPAGGEGCVCKGLCAQHVGVGIDPEGRVAQWIVPTRDGRPIEAAAVTARTRAEARRTSFARAPPAAVPSSA